MNPRSIDTTRRPVVLVWELTQACELACKHCRADAQPYRHPDELTTTEGRQLLDDVRRFAAGQLVVLSGGDPLARDDAMTLIEHGVDVGLSMTLTPSGTASLTDRRINRLAAIGLRRLALSVDGGSARTHDEFRGEPGSFDRTVEAARKTRDVGLPLQINTTVCHETVDELPAILDIVDELGAVLWSVFFLVPIGRGRVLDPVSPERAEAIMEWLVNVQGEVEFTIKTTEAPHFRRVALQRRNAETPQPGSASEGATRRTGITAGNGFAFVDHVGEVYPSGFLPLSTGSIRDRSVVEIYREAELFRRLRDPNALRGPCGACSYRSVCGGSRSRAYASTGDPLASDPLCSYRPDGYEGLLPEQRRDLPEQEKK